MGMCLIGVLNCSGLHFSLGDDGVDLTLLLGFHAALDEDVRYGYADNDGEDDGYAVNAEPQRLEEFLNGDGLNVEYGEEKAVEQDTGDERNDRRDDEQGVRCVNDADDLQCRNADNGRGGKGSLGPPTPGRGHFRRLQDPTI